MRRVALRFEPALRVLRALVPKRSSWRLAQVDTLAELPAVEARRPAAEQGKARASTTDPEARVMKMADGGFRPAVNVRFAAGTAHRLIVGGGACGRGASAPLTRSLCSHPLPPRERVTRRG